MRLSGTKTSSVNQYNGLGDQLYDLGGARPTLDLNFSSNESLVDSVTGKTLVDHTRASSATYVDGDGVIRTAVTNLFLRSEEFDDAYWSKSNATITANAIESPSNQITADKFGETTATSIHRVRRNVSVVNGTAYTVSFYVKSGERSEIYSDFFGTVSGASISYNASTDTFISVGSGVDSHSSESVGDGWYRVRYTITSESTQTGTVQFYLSVEGSLTYTGDGTSGIYLWGAQLEQSSTAGQYVKTTTAINSAPRFDHEVTRTTTNLLTYSEEHNTASSYDGLELFGVGSVADALQAPDGTITADKITEDTSSGFHRVGKSFSHKNGETYTYSVFLKAGTRKKAHLQLSSNLFTIAFFDLEAGTSGAGGTIQDVGNGWFRCSISNTATADGTAEGRVEITNDDNQRNYVGDGESFLYVWGAQVETGSDVGPYVKTTGAAATKVDAESLGLLVEESRTNLLTYSEEFNQWSKDKTTVTPNQAIAPDGTNSADLFTNTTGSGQHLIYVNPAVTATTYTVSAYFKEPPTNSQRYVHLTMWGMGYVAFDIQTGTVAQSYGSGIVGSDIYSAGNGWYRCSVTYLKDNTNAGTYIGLHDGTSGGHSYTGDGVSGLLVWGAQLENASFPTSYIRTEGSTVTRSADVTSIEGNDFGTFNLLQYSEELNQLLGPQRGTITSNVLTAPDGTLTADKFEKTESGATYSYVSQSFTQNTNYTFSVYAKAGNTGEIRFNDFSTGNSVDFNIATETVVSVGTDWSNANIENVGNGWYRVSAILTPTTTGSRNVSYSFINTSNSGDYVYLWGAQLEESSTATPYVKSDVTWTSRASNATYYDYTGTLKKSSYNLLLRSEEFDNASWIANKASAFGSGSIANAGLAPNGTVTADKLAEGTSYGYQTIYQGYSAASGLTLTFSVYVKADERNVVVLRENIDNNYEDSRFDLATGTVYSTAPNRTSSIQPVGNGWYRISVTSTTTASTFVGLNIAPALSTSVIQYTGDGTSGIYLWGAQVETGTYAGDYAKTEGSAASTARTAAYLPDASGNFVSAGELLLEGAGTNYIKYSENLVTHPWIAPTGSTLSLSTELAPDGTATAYKYTATNSANYFYYINAAPTTNTTATLSFWVKNISATSANVGVLDTSPVSWIIDPTSSGSYISEINTNGWIRIEKTFTVGSSPISVYPAHGVNTGGELLIWGVQLETNSYPTSYIPTQGSTATRAADVSSSSSNTFGNSFYNQTEGTVFSYWQTQKIDDAGIYDFNDGSGSNFMWHWVNSTNQIHFRYRTSGVNAFNVTSIANPLILTKTVQSFKQNDFAACTNGSTVFTDTSGNIAETMDRLDLGVISNQNPDLALSGTISRLTVWPTRLSNDTLQTITV